MAIISQRNENVNICRECGATVYAFEAERYRESHGLDEPPFEDFMVCPHCNGDLLPARRCEHCGELFDEDLLTDGLCAECYQEWEVTECQCSIPESQPM